MVRKNTSEMKINTHMKLPFKISVKGRHKKTSFYGHVYCKGCPHSSQGQLFVIFIQGGFFNCSHPKFLSTRKKPKCQNLLTDWHLNGTEFFGWEQYGYFNFFLSLFFLGWNLEIFGWGQLKKTTLYMLSNLLFYCFIKEKLTISFFF